MNVQNVLNSFTQSQSENEQAGQAAANEQLSPLASISSFLPGGLAGGAAAGGVMALLLGSKSTRKMAKKVATIGGTAVLGGLAYKAYGNWQQNRAMGQTQPATSDDIEQAIQAAPALANQSAIDEHNALSMTLIKTMVAAAKADGNVDSFEQKKMFDAIEKLNLSAEDKAAVFDLLSRDITIQEIAESVSLDEHKAEVYLSAYLAIEVDNQLERTFLNNLGMALNLPKGFPAYLEQQADQGIAA